jgi:DNA polymerase I-like protein with 3'-5' exonuclease and polymerase domains
MQLPMFLPETDWKPPEILPDFAQADAICIDVETNDPDLKNTGAAWPWKGGHIAGYAIGLKFGTTVDCHYLPVQHENGDNLDKGLVTRYMKGICKSPTLKVFHNSLYDMGWMWAEGIEDVQGPIFDTQSGAALLDENRMSYSLDNLGKDWLNHGKDEKLLHEAAATFGFKKNVKGSMWRLPPQYVGPYGEGDVRVTMALYEHEQTRLEKDNLTDLMELEMGIVPMLLEMRKRGVRVNYDRAEQVREELSNELAEDLISMKTDYGMAIDVWSGPSLQKAWDANGMEYGRTPTGKASFTKESLAANPHPLAKMVLRCRQVDKTIGTFMDGMILGNSHKGRIHHELHALKGEEGGTVTGRFSCSNPNLQQATGRDPVLTPLVRGMFLPEEGTLWGAFDYASQEPRLTVHYAAKTKQLGAEEAVAGYNEDPKMDYHGMVAALAGIDRKPAKTINLGLAYGMGQVKLCQDLGLPTEWIVDDRTGRQREVAGAEGRALIDTYHEKIPFVRGLTRTCTSRAQERGWIRTIGGRLCRFDQWESGKGRKGAPVNSKETAIKKWGNPVRRAFTHKAMNRLIQGSAADQTKKAMLMMWQEGIVPMHQMHDELDISISSKKEVDIVIDIMENCEPLLVPVVVDAEFGNTWADAVHSWEDMQ